MKSICSVGTNAAKYVTKLHTVNAVLILIALYSKVYSLRVSFSDNGKSGLSVKDDAEANSCSVSHIPTLLAPQQSITFSQESVMLLI